MLVVRAMNSDATVADVFHSSGFVTAPMSVVMGLMNAPAIPVS